MTPPQTWDVRARFVALTPPFQGRSFPILLFPAVIGRGVECAVCLDAVSISRQHASVEEKDGRFIIRDLGSRNGIRIADQPVHDALLNPGDIVTVGDIQLRFEPVPAPAPEPAAPIPQEPPRTLTGQDIVALVQSMPQGLSAEPGPEAPPQAPPDSQPRVGLNLKMIAVVVAALIFSCLAGAFILSYIGHSVEALKAQWPAVMVEVGQKKWIQISRIQFLKSDADPWWVATDLRERDIRQIAVGNTPSGVPSTSDDVISVEKYDPGEILITGKSVGESTVTLTLNSGSVLTMRVIVRGRLEDPLDPLLYGAYSAPERIAMARQFLDSGALIENEKPYLALQEYQKAKAVLTPLPDAAKGDLYFLQILPRLTSTQRTVDDRWSTLRGQIAVAVASKDFTTAIDDLQQAVKLIPDPNDPRHQKADGELHALIRRQLEEKE